MHAAKASLQNLEVQFFVKKVNSNMFQLDLAHVDVVLNKKRCSVRCSVSDARTGCASCITDNSVQG